MNEQLFSSLELDDITKEATFREERYVDTIIISGKSTATSIHTMTPINRLIFPEGNDYTGYKHLRERHSQHVYKNYWITTHEGQVKLDRPSKFHPDIVPIHYSAIADAVFSSENKNVTKNHRPELFDKYTGFYAHKANQPEKYHLLTYKDTRIIHTMYPDKKKHNLKEVAKFGKGHVWQSQILVKNYADLIVPYEDQMGIIKYSILLRRFYTEQVERIYIREHDENGDSEYLIFLGERKINDFNRFDHTIMSSFQHRDLIDYERIINQLAAGIEDIMIDPSTFRW